jgi:hypothetical protein
MGRPALNFPIGTRFERLVILCRAESLPSGARWLCRCDCGVELKVRAADLKSGHTKSCGCFMVDTTIAMSTTHGHAPRGEVSPTYVTYHAMIERCTNPKMENFPFYGGRGISVCERWRASFEAFLEDVGERPNGTTIERIDNDGNYEPGNIRWATKKAQMNNTRRSRRVEYAGTLITVAELADRVNLPYDVLYKRIFYRQMSVAAASAKPCARVRQATSSGSRSAGSGIA